ncbi:MAG TPA: phage holin family protein [Cyclobacteriaceae bacterium]|nr:phage holin family protein [Cyclobacteriaceae bacterium]
MLKETLLKFLKLDGLVNNLTGYIETRIELMKYEVKEDMARAISKVALILMISVFFLFFLLFASAAIAHKIGESLGSFAGYGIVAGFYLTLLLLIVLLREPLGNRVEKKIKDIIIKK